MPATRYPVGVSGNPKGRPKGKRGLPYARILDRLVRIKDGGRARQVTGEEAFFLRGRKFGASNHALAQAVPRLFHSRLPGAARKESGQ